MSLLYFAFLYFWGMCLPYIALFDIVAKPIAGDAIVLHGYSQYCLVALIIVGANSSPVHGLSKQLCQNKIYMSPNSLTFYSGRPFGSSTSKRTFDPVPLVCAICCNMSAISFPRLTQSWMPFFATLGDAKFAYNNSSSKL